MASLDEVCPSILPIVEARLDESHQGFQALLTSITEVEAVGKDFRCGDLEGNNEIMDDFPTTFQDQQALVAAAHMAMVNYDHISEAENLPRRLNN